MWCDVFHRLAQAADAAPAAVPGLVVLPAGPALGAAPPRTQRPLAALPLSKQCSCREHFTWQDCSSNIDRPAAGDSGRGAHAPHTHGPLGTSSEPGLSGWWHRACNAEGATAIK